MSTAVFANILDAMHNKQQVTCVYQGLYREICPHTIGWKDGQAKVWGFQFAGESSNGLSADGEWRCMFIAGMADVAIKDGAWHTRDDYRRPQSCIDNIELEVTA